MPPPAEAVAPSLDASRGEDAFVADTLCNGPIQVVEASADDLAGDARPWSPSRCTTTSRATPRWAAYLDEIEALKNEVLTLPEDARPAGTDADEND